MNWTTRITLLIGLCSTLACTAPKSFEYRDVRNIEVDKLGFDKSRIKLDLVYFNPNRFRVDIKKVDCEVYMNDQYLGRYQLDTLMRVPKQAEFVLPSSMQVDMRGVFKNALTVLLNKEVTMRVKGTTRVGKSGVFVNMPFTYEGKHKLDLLN